MHKIKFVTPAHWLQACTCYNYVLFHLCISLDLRRIIILTIRTFNSRDLETPPHLPRTTIIFVTGHERNEGTNHNNHYYNNQAVILRRL